MNNNMNDVNTNFSNEAFRNLAETILYGPKEQANREAKRNFTTLVKIISSGDLDTAYDFYMKVLDSYADKMSYVEFIDNKDFKAYINEDKKTVAIKTHDGFITKVKCDEEDEFNPIAGVAIAYMKYHFGIANSREFVKAVQEKMYYSNKKDEEPQKDLDVKDTHSKTKSDSVSNSASKSYDDISDKKNTATPKANPKAVKKVKETSSDVDALSMIRDAIKERQKKNIKPVDTSLKGKSPDVIRAISDIIMEACGD